MTLKCKIEVFEGVNIADFKRIDEASKYNYNYYTYKDHILLGLSSDDDHETEWFLISAYSMYDLVGYSSINDTPEMISVTNKRHT